MGDVFSFFAELYETEDIYLETDINDNVDVEDKDEIDENKRNWINIRIYYNESMRNPEYTLNMDLCKAISKAYRLTRELRQFIRDQESYNREKEYYSSIMSKAPLRKIDHSGISEEDRRLKMIEELKKTPEIIDVVWVGDDPEHRPDPITRDNAQ